MSCVEVPHWILPPPQRIYCQWVPWQTGEEHPTRQTHHHKHQKHDRGTCPKAVVPTVHCWSHRQDWMCLPPPRDPSALWIQRKNERSSSENKAAHSWTRQERSCLQSTLWRVQLCVHRWNRKNPEEATYQTQSGSEDMRQEEWYCCACLEVGTPSGVGVCQSEVSCTKPHPQKDCGSSTYLPDTKHDKPGLWLNPFDSIWFPLLTWPSKLIFWQPSHPVLRITLYCAYHHYIILILLCHPVPPFPPVVAL